MLFSHAQILEASLRAPDRHGGWRAGAGRGGARAFPVLRTTVLWFPHTPLCIL